MTREDLTEQLSSLLPGFQTGISYEVFEDLFPPGVLDVNAQEACYWYASSLRCVIENDAKEKAIWFTKRAENQTLRLLNQRKR